MGLADGTHKEPLLQRVRKSASRARELISKILHTRLQGSSSGGLESLQKSLDALDSHVAAYDLPLDTSRLRMRLEALLSILLDVKDDRIAGEAAGPLETALANELPRLEAMFLQPGEFFSLLDRGSPELAQVHASADAEDYANARTALASQLKKHVVADDITIWLTRTAMHSHDEAVLAGRGFLKDRDGSHAFSEWPVRWDLAPDFAHRHDELATLAREYASSGTESWAVLATEHVLGWAICVPPPCAKQSAGAWNPAFAARRLTSWAVAFMALRKAKAFTPEFARVFMSLVHESAEFVAQCIQSIKHDPARAEAAAGLAVAGAVFGQFAGAKSWQVEASSALDECSRSAILPDGGHFSGSMEVHERVFEALIAGGAAGAFGDDAGTPPATDAAKRMLAFHKSVTLPDGSLPYERPRMSASPAERASRVDFAAAYLGVPNETRVADFHSFPDSGVYVMRAGVDAAAEYLLVQSSGTRELVIASPGGQVMRLSGSPAQSEAGVVPQPAADGPRNVVVHPGPPTDYVRTVTGLARGAHVHRREVMFVDRRYVVLCDRVESDTASSWTLELEFPASIACSADGRRLQTSGFLVVLAGPTDCALKPAETVATNRGALHCMRAQTQGSDVRFVVLVYPLRDDTPEQISVEPVVGKDACVGLLLKRPASEDLVCFPHGTDLKLEGVPAGSQAVALRRSATGASAPWSRLFDISDDE